MQDEASRHTQEEADLARIRTLHTGDPGLLVNTTFVIIRLGADRYRLGQLYGDWLLQGTAEQVIRHAYHHSGVESRQQRRQDAPELAR